MKFNEVQNVQGVHAASYVDFTRPIFTVLLKQLPVGTVGVAGACACMSTFIHSFHAFQFADQARCSRHSMAALQPALSWDFLHHVIESSANCRLCVDIDVKQCSSAHAQPAARPRV